MFNAPAAPAPLAAAELDLALRPFGESQMLPRAAYVSPEVFSWEQEHFFASGWTCVGHGSDLRHAGDLRAVSAGKSGLLLTRAEDGRLRAFANCCRHRGHELLACGESDNRGRIICPYHAWTYDLRGELKAAAGFKGRPGFDAESHGLIELPCEEWAGLVFVDPSAAAGSFAGWVGTLTELISDYQADRLVVAARHEYEVAANWKILTENYHECYHCPSIHPQLCEISPPRDGANYRPDGAAWVGGYMELKEGMTTMSLDGSSPIPPLPLLQGEVLRHVVYVNVFPNLLLSLHPDYVMTHLLTPLGVDRTHIECAWAFAPETIEDPAFDPAFAVDFWDLTNSQDWAACESVQRGLSSPQARPGPLSSEEDAVYQYVTMVARAYLGEAVRNVVVAAGV